jgi:hypothetical protein
VILRAAEVTEITTRLWRPSPACPAGGDSVVASSRDTEEAEMLSGEMANHRIADRVREADLERRARQTRRSRMADERSLGRRVARAAVAVVAWPIKH